MSIAPTPDLEGVPSEILCKIAASGPLTEAEQACLALVSKAIRSKFGTAYEGLTGPSRLEFLQLLEPDTEFLFCPWCQALHYPLLCLPHATRRRPCQFAQDAFSPDLPANYHAGVLYGLAKYHRQGRDASLLENVTCVPVQYFQNHAVNATRSWRLTINEHGVFVQKREVFRLGESDVAARIGLSEQQKQFAAPVIRMCWHYDAILHVDRLAMSDGRSGAEIFPDVNMSNPWATQPPFLAGEVVGCEDCNRDFLVQISYSTSSPNGDDDEDGGGAPVALPPTSRSRIRQGNIKGRAGVLLQRYGRTVTGGSASASTSASSSVDTAAAAGGDFITAGLAARRAGLKAGRGDLLRRSSIKNAIAMAALSREGDKGKGKEKAGPFAEATATQRQIIVTLTTWFYLGQGESPTNIAKYMAWSPWAQLPVLGSGNVARLSRLHINVYNSRLPGTKKLEPVSKLDLDKLELAYSNPVSFKGCSVGQGHRVIPGAVRGRTGRSSMFSPGLATKGLTTGIEDGPVKWE
ncbi:uncharacterized protein BCR38DRAFT_406846 [Pseudomassariella vexata]|uniref:Uncharacterized protein n=1 Tax=Pseudomassariella vexata TaxID=1141098 RepID=A0A1Y2EBM0_9PEZI|nr:uncharacterized protein BCR38DRAFT_406846 [Pseudomassariella vexata]ORY68969.1 hypothetical protein BCR38DRAFT_406846 [Pseudomassariella vexata]